MTKIQKIKLSNFKAISDLEMDFKGCTCLITGANNSGKTSFLKGIPDRVRFVRPDVMVKKGETEGRGEMVLTTGEKFIWNFNTEGVDKLTYVTDQGAKQSVTKDLGSQFFPPVFDIDKFLQSSPKQQATQLQAIIGLDFTDIDTRYDKAYALRTERNREAELYRVKLEKMIRCERVDFVDLTDLTARKEAEKKRLNDLYLENRRENQEKRDQHAKAKAKVDKEISEYIEIQFKAERVFNACHDALSVLTANGYTGNAGEFVSDLEKKIMPPKFAFDFYPEEPNYIEEMPDKAELDRIDQMILAASETNAAAQKYKEYVDHVNATKAARSTADEANWVVINIEEDRQKLIESANFPKGISITSEGILVDGLPLDKNQISTSKLYTSALRIASMNLGEVRTLYFDASFLDRNSLAEIQAWAQENDLQLLIERPDFEGNEISYEIIETI